MSRRNWMLIGALCALVNANVAIAEDCGDLANGYGPFDYRSQRDKLGIVEKFHFTAEVEALIRGKSGPLLSDIDYTLRASPNHHRALVAMMRYAERAKSPQPRGMPRSVDCYFERALRFRKDDTTARLLLAGYLSRTGRKDEAMRQIAGTAEHARNNGFTQYNVGLMYLELGEHQKALEHAHRAIALGFVERDELRKQLQAAGKWVEPETKPAEVVPAEAKSASQPAS